MKAFGMKGTAIWEGGKRRKRSVSAMRRGERPKRTHALA